MAGPYWIKWQTSKWLTDPELSNCTPATRGIWADLLNRIYELDADGSIIGTVRSLSQQARCQMDELEDALEEMELFNVCEIERVSGTQDLIKITSRHAQRYLEKKKKERERKRESREDESNVTDDERTSNGQAPDNSRTNSGKSEDTHASAQKNSNSSSSSNSSSGKGKGGAGGKGKPKYVSKSPPEIDEVRAYFVEKGAPEEEADKFLDHFASQGWRLANGNPMKDWQASVRNWIRRIPEFKARGSPGAGPMTYHEARQDWERRGQPGGKFPGDEYEPIEQKGDKKPLWRRAV